MAEADIGFGSGRCLCLFLPALQLGLVIFGLGSLAAALAGSADELTATPRPITRDGGSEPMKHTPTAPEPTPEEQARLEETITGTQPMVMEEDMVLAWPVEEAEETVENAAPADSEDTPGGRSREFDWGD